MEAAGDLAWCWTGDDVRLQPLLGVCYVGEAVGSGARGIK